MGRTTGADHSLFYRQLRECEKLQVTRDEMTWLQTYQKPDHGVDVVMSFGCGNQSVPHLMLVVVTVLRKLGIGFVATAGPQFCCGKPYQGEDETQSIGDRVAATSIQRFASWEPTTNVHSCGSCFVEFTRHVGSMRERGEAPFEVVHLTRFLLETLKRLGDAVPWKRSIPTRVLLHAEGAVVHPSKAVHRADVIETLGLIPGVEFAGLVYPTSFGSPCVTKPDSEVSILNDLDADDYRFVQAELQEQADAVGAEMILTHHHKCHREWSKLSSPKLPVVYYPALISEALGIGVKDRFQMLWQLGDIDRIHAATRPYWESWDIPDDEARELVEKFFSPKYQAAIQHCPCEGICLSREPRDHADEPACAASAGVTGRASQQADG